ncbi:hypothetical protein H9P43_002536 [Blastocladiella emersonii ATCC 22665]|nr:hypothetical protein H9P43_002536 [Blastocladiella emersonii ATCC 22665]
MTAVSARQNLPLLVPFARQFYMSGYQSARVVADPFGSGATFGGDLPPPGPLSSSSDAPALTTQVQKVALHLRESAKHALEVTASRVRDPGGDTAELHVSVATQIGCRHNCSYCVSSRLGGLRRNLNLEEMLAQVMYFRAPGAFAEEEGADAELAAARGGGGGVASVPLLDFDPATVGGHGQLPADYLAPLTSVSLHGHGEPLDNPETLDFLDFLRSPSYNAAFGASPRTSVSTVGILGPLDELLADFPDTAVAWTLTTPFAEHRLQLMRSVEEHSPLDRVLGLMHSHARRRAVPNLTVSYLLLAGINDSRDHLDALVRLVRPTGLPVSLIQFHPVLTDMAVPPSPPPSPAVEAPPRPSPRLQQRMLRRKSPLPQLPPFGRFEPSSPATLDRWHRDLTRLGVAASVQQYFEFPSLSV